MFSYVWPIALVILSNVIYQICAKSGWRRGKRGPVFRAQSRRESAEGIQKDKRGPVCPRNCHCRAGGWIYLRLQSRVAGQYRIYRAKFLSRGRADFCGLSALPGSADLEQTGRHRHLSRGVSGDKSQVICQFPFDKDYRNHPIGMQENSGHGKTSIWEYQYFFAIREGRQFTDRSGKGMFVKGEGAPLALREELRDVISGKVFADQMKDVIEYRTMDYYQRRYRERAEKL